MSKLDLIRENLYLGDLYAAAEILKNGSSEISHVLTVIHCPSISTFEEWSDVKLDSKEIKEVYVNGDDDQDSLLLSQEFATESALPSGNLLYSLEYAGKDLKITRMAVFAWDRHWENILDFFDLCLDFIDKGRKEKGVLVHCFAGQSRSASMVIAYLMRTEKLSWRDACESLRQSAHISPNLGFLKQLDLFERMNFKVDRSSSIYKHFRLKALGYLYSKDKKFDKSKLRADPEISNVTTTSGCTYQCKKCRRVVLLQEQVIDHTPGEADTEFDDMFLNMIGEVHKKSVGEETKCTSIFVEPMSWMSSVETDVKEGKVLCPKCQARLGSFDWSGSYCSCGSKIVPAFQLQKSRVDVISNVKNEVKRKKK